MKAHMKKAMRHDSTDPGFIERVKAAAMERDIPSSNADAARLRMMKHKGMIKDQDSAEKARLRMISRHERRNEA